MSEFVVDYHTLLHLARATRARHDALETGETEAKANEAFEKIFLMPRKPEYTIPALDQYPDLNNRLIEFLELHFEAEKLKTWTDEFHEKLFVAWEHFELMRRLTAMDLKSLRLKSPSRTPVTPI